MKSTHRLYIGVGTVSIFAASAIVDAAAASYIACSNNSTHISWAQDPDSKDDFIKNIDGGCSYQSVDEARAEITAYLWQNIMPYDVPNAITLGFDVSALTGFDHADTGDAAEVELNKESHGIRSTSRFMQQQLQDQPTVDGLADGILNQTLYYSMLSKILYPWTDAIPHAIYLEYVVPFAVVNEPRTDYRSLLFDALRENLREFERPAIMSGRNHNQVQVQTSYDETQNQIKKMVKLINTRLWSIMGRDASKPIKFQAGLTPRIYDPLSVIAYGHSSCTGLAVLLISALRTVGIAARMAGTPAWNGKEECGNHSWLEVFLPNESGGEWVFLEPSPGIAEGDEESANADDMDRDPCERWFCKADRFDGSTHVSATRYTKTVNALYKMAWAVGENGVPGENRTEYYTSVCGQCGK